MADYRLSSEPLIRERAAEDPVASFARGYGTISGIGTDIMRQRLMQQQLAKSQKEQQALEAYGQTGKPEVFKGVNPELALKLEEHLDKQTPEALKGWEKAANFISKSRGVINPQNWDAYADAVEAQGWLPKGSLPRGVQPDQLQQILYMPELIQTKIAASKNQTTIIGPGGRTQTVPGRAAFDPRLKEKSTEQLEAEAAAKEKGKRSITPQKEGEFTTAYNEHLKDAAAKGEQPQTRMEFRKRWVGKTDPEEKAPTVKRMIDEATGREFDAEWNPKTREWEKVKGTGVKAPTKTGGNVLKFSGQPGAAKPGAAANPNLDKLTQLHDPSKLPEGQTAGGGKYIVRGGKWTEAK